jgi:molybdopterin molybdotransferase
VRKLVGDYDYMKAVLDRLGRMDWWQLAIKPAKPLAFGVVDGKPVFGLPGNPVSALVSFELFVRPALRQMGGHRSLYRPEVTAVADEALRRRPDGKVHFQRVVARWEEDDGGAGGWHVRPAGGQGSHQLLATARANGLAVVPDGDGVAAGAAVRLLLLS